MITMRTFFVGAGVFLFTVFALADLNYSKKMNILEKNYLANAMIGQFAGRADKIVGYTLYHFEGEKRPQKKAAVVISPGRTEPSMKYLELSYDLMLEGYYPVYVIDHRGQGTSEDLIEETKNELGKRRGHADKFQYFVDDFTYFAEKIVKPKEDKVMLLTHSMGSTVAGHYLKLKDQIFEAAVFASPMIALQQQEWVIMNVMVDNCDEAAPESNCEEFAGSGHDWHSTKSLNFNDPEINDLSHDPERYANTYALFNENPSLRLGSVTWGWLYHMITGARNLRGKKGTKGIQLPMLVLQAGNERVVEKEYMSEDFCDYIKGCKVRTIPEAFHEIWFEEEVKRNLALKESIDFFNSHIKK